MDVLSRRQAIDLSTCRATRIPTGCTGMPTHRPRRITRASLPPTWRTAPRSPATSSTCGLSRASPATSAAHAPTAARSLAARTAPSRAISTPAGKSVPTGDIVLIRPDPVLVIDEIGRVVEAVGGITVNGGNGLGYDTTLQGYVEIDDIGNSKIAGTAVIQANNLLIGTDRTAPESEVSETAWHGARQNHVRQHHHHQPVRPGVAPE
ncbi:MAG: hypothetical protein MZV64_15755 [Ignavibacteriales bacterium]|nr:hypothetical protein [Ignavibacteriales bacterium]